MTSGKWRQWVMVTVMALLLIAGCDRDGRNEQNIHPAPQAAVPTDSDSLKHISKNEPVIQPGSLIYLLIPMEQAKGLNMIEKKFINGVANIYADKEPFTDIEREFRVLRAKYAGKNAENEIGAIDVVLREIQRFKSVYEGKSALIQVPERVVSFPDIWWAEEINAALRSYGYVFLELESDTFHPAHPPKISSTQWEQCKANRILTGKWKGAVQISTQEILLPGLKCFKDQKQVKNDRIIQKEGWNLNKDEQENGHQFNNSFAKARKIEYTQFLIKYFYAYSKAGSGKAELKRLVVANSKLIESLIKDYFYLIESVASDMNLRDLSFEWSQGFFLDFGDLSNIIASIGYFASSNKENNGLVMEDINQRIEKIIMAGIESGDAASKLGKYDVAIHKYEAVAKILDNVVNNEQLKAAVYERLSELHEGRGNFAKSAEYKEKAISAKQ